MCTRCEGGGRLPRRPRRDAKLTEALASCPELFLQFGNGLEVAAELVRRPDVSASRPDLHPLCAAVRAIGAAVHALHTGKIPHVRERPQPPSFRFRELKRPRLRWVADAVPAGLCQTGG